MNVFYFEKIILLRANYVTICLLIYHRMRTKDYVPVLKNKGIFIYLPSYTVFCVLKLSAVCSNYSINGLLFCVPLKLIKLDLVVSTTSNDERKKQTTIVLERTKSIWLTCILAAFLPLRI